MGADAFPRQVGSGFDVSSAVYGSQRYVRMSGEAMAQWMQLVDSCTAPSATATQYADAAARLCDTADASWDFAVEPFALPPGLQLMCGDVCGGSETPSMVRKVPTYIPTLIALALTPSKRLRCCRGRPQALSRWSGAQSSPRRSARTTRCSDWRSAPTSARRSTRALWGARQRCPPVRAATDALRRAHAASVQRNGTPPLVMRCVCCAM